MGSVSNNFDETFPRPQAGPFGVVREDGDQERVTVLVAAFEGWNDAGDAATDAVQFLAAHYGAKDVFEVTSDDYYDYQFSRPLVRRGATGDVKIVWPTTRLSTATVPGTNLDLVLLHGWEPSYRWRSFTAELLEQATLLDVDFVVMVGALLADVPHTRPIPVTKTSDTAELQDELGIDSSQYEGPTGIVGLLSHMASLGGFPTVSLWAAVPHYVAQSPSPKAGLALLRELEELLSITLPLDAIAEDAEAWERGVNELASDDPEIAAYVQQLEEAKDTTDLPEATGDAIAKEFERYLRRRRDEK
ncbi:PAC2 family protein [Kocuria rosea]|uniref:PAC2 family protein n=1 Tax=Kocuria rosea TaxID=1275 RepID=UPI002B24D716|nr:PAC2 family protein [Kocuria rosea]MEB2526282.1 PAC2 family protein [Kocuria rosea]MEB2619519.1 PAC2 family protein [Kocuria rosea]